MNRTTIRVFPRKTRATPEDEFVRVNCEPGLFDKADEVRVSRLFTWDRERSEQLAEAWAKVAPVKIGGPAWGSRGEEFHPGEYIKHGYVITSRGCPNRCWFCSVWRREGSVVRELPINDGWNVLDDNLLACQEKHVRGVFAMLSKQSRPIEFTGGWEAARLRGWHVDLLSTIRLGAVWFAYDTADDLEPLIEAGKQLDRAGISRTSSGAVSHRVRCYCLVGYPKDTMSDAEGRMRAAYASGFLPMAMLYRNERGETAHEWRRFQKFWARPAAINRMCRDGTAAQI